MYQLEIWNSAEKLDCKPFDLDPIVRLA